ncbi:MAG: adenylyl-sulfate kinase [Acidimicrobiales bacterium]
MSDITWHGGHFSRPQRWAALGHAGATVWLTGLSGSGKSTIAAAVEARLLEAGRPAYMLDGDNLRHGLNAGLGFSAEDRDENVRRVGEVALLMADAGTVALVCLISPFRAGRDRARAAHAAAGLDFFEVWVNTPIEVCRRRDPKGLYARAEAGAIQSFTGIDSPYEEPVRPELEIRTDEVDLAEAVARVVGLLD